MSPRSALMSAVALATLFASSSVHAQARPIERPPEDDIFGGGASGGGTPSAPTTPAPPSPPGDPSKPVGSPPSSPDNQAARLGPQSPTTSDAAVPASSPSSGATADERRDDAILGSGEMAKSQDEVAAEDPLRIGGQLYLRASSSMRDGQAPQNWSLSSPTLLDTYIDARPNERVRAFVRARTTFDATLPPNGTTSTSSLASAQAFPLFSQSSNSATRGPVSALDQMWLRFDLKRAVFVTVGRQHVKWGTGKIWNPTDYLHFAPRNPIDLFDARTGTTMVKVHVPWEAKGWNFYGFALTESPGTTNTVRQVAGAGRAEIVYGPAELGLDFLVRDGAKPRYGADISFGIADVDFYGEVALRYGSEIDRVSYDENFLFNPNDPNAKASLVTEGLFPRYRSPGRKVQTVGGASYSLKYNDNDVLMFGVEYFYNQLGYDDKNAYLGVLAPRDVPLANPASFFYLGRNYLAAYIIANAPYSWNLTTFRLTSLSNLTDNSHLVRFDYGFTLLTHVTFEAFVAGHFGAHDGELRAGFDLLKAYGPAFDIKPLVMDLGVALRVAL